MAVYRQTYRDPNTGKKKKLSRVWWYEFSFSGRRIRESSKSARKTLAIDAEKKRRLELEQGFNDVKDSRTDRVRPLSEVATAFLGEYKLRHARSATFAEYAIGHLISLKGTVMMVDITDQTVKEYQSARLKAKAAPKSINEEVGFLLRVMGEQGDMLRAKLRRQKALKLTVSKGVAKAFSPEMKAALLTQAKKRRSPAIYPGLMLALHSGLRDAELRGLQWGRVDLVKAIVTVGDSKTDAGQGRTVPLNSDALAAMVAHSKWFLTKFGTTKPDLFVFPFGKPQPTDPTRPMTTFRTAWAKIKADAGVVGRWHDNRHTFITDLAESGEASDETIQELAGHVSKQMLKHYSHIRMEAKRRAVDSLNVKPKAAETPQNPIGVPIVSPMVSETAN